jgi:hypothetical protein
MILHHYGCFLFEGTQEECEKQRTDRCAVNAEVCTAEEFGEVCFDYGWDSGYGAGMDECE